MLCKLLVFALILCVAMPIVAQVEFRTDLEYFDGLEDAPYTRLGLSVNESLFIGDAADFLDLMNDRDRFCSDVIPTSDDPDYGARVCVYNDTEAMIQLLHADGDYQTDFIVFYNDELIGVFGKDGVREAGIPELSPGYYEVLVFHNGLEFVGKVNFDISDASEQLLFRTEMMNTDGPNEYSRLSQDHGTIARYLYKTERDRFCTGDIPPIGTTNHTKVCVFEDSRTGEQILYVSEVEEGGTVTFASSGSFNFVKVIVLLDSQIIGVLSRSSGRGISSLSPGEYELLVLYHFAPGRKRLPVYRFGSVSFTIPDPSELSAGN